MSKIAQILDLTDNLETLVVEGRWGEAAALEDKRRDLLEDYVGTEACDAVVLAGLYERSQQLLSESKDQQSAARKAMLSQMKASRAAGAYENHTPDKSR